ncbi:MAG: fatty acid hydroxylase [Sphingomonadales bacterium]|nr:MAG: fatty acid hydroxylase [Sphingomonadales bacterium]
MVIKTSAQSSADRLRLFRNPWLERLTVISAGWFIALWAVLLPAIAYVGYATAPVFWALPLIVAGAVVWTLAEYALHRYVFHFETRSPLIRQVIFVIHSNHHEHPNDSLRNLMPPIVSVPVGGLIWGLSLWALGAQGTWFLLGFMSGYVAYDLVHFACHQFPMKGRIGRALKLHHMRHHHLKVEGNYAITGMIWDRIFSTRISKVEQA